MELYRCYLVLVLLASSVELGEAQTESASISGTILDASGGSVGNADIEADSLVTGAKRTATTAASGLYSLAALGVGHYRVTVQAPGFQTYTWPDVQIQVGQNRTLDAKLQVASTGTTVEVKEEATPLDEVSATVGGVVSGTQVRQLPINGRSWASLMTQTPGAVDSGTDNQRSIRFVGRGQDDNNYRFDGVDATGILNQSEKGNFRLEFSEEAIEEFRVNAALYTAESGGTQGGQVDVVSRGGTNEFHGSIFEYLRNDAFDARGPFDGPSLPPFRLNQFGGSLGGPIRKDRDFFFAVFEALRQRIGQTLIGFVPSPTFRAQAAITSPALIPILAAYPTGTLPTSDQNVFRWIGTGRQVTNENSGMIRYDHKFSDANTLSVRYNVDDGLLDVPNGVLRDRTATTLLTHNGLVELTTVVSPRSINEFKAGFNRSDYATKNESVLNVQISAPQFSTLYNDTGKIQASNSFDYLDTFSTLKGRHQIRAGVEIRRVQLNSTATSSNDYELTYGSTANVLNNILSQESLVSTLPTTGLRRTEYFGFVQDEYRVTPTLTADLGVRYEFFGVPSEVKGRGIVFDPLTCPGGYCPAGSNFYNPDYNNFSPRISFAWAPQALNNRTVIRSGYGIYYGDGQLGDLTAPVDNLAGRIVLSSGNLSFPVPSTFGNDSFVPTSPRSLDRNRVTPYTQDWGFSVQQAITTNTILTVGYTGNKGTHQFTRTYLNTADPVTHRIPYPQFGIIDYKTTSSNSTFNALQVSLQRNLSKNFITNVNYMWSHSINDGATGGGEADYPENVRCRACERASSDQDVPQYLSGSLIYRLPFGRGQKYLNGSGLVSAILGGWQYAGILSARAGVPVNITLSRLPANIPDGNNSSPQRPNVVPSVPINPVNQNISDYLNINAFSTPAPGTFGNAGRNLARGPSSWQLDSALVKQIPIYERLNLTFRAEAFNLFNHPHYGTPNANFSNPASFGQITTTLNSTGIGTGTPRELEFALRLEF